MRLNEKGHSAELQIVIFLAMVCLAVALPFARSHGALAAVKMAVLTVPAALVSLVLAVVLIAKPAEILGEMGAAGKLLGWILGVGGLIFACWMPVRFYHAVIADPGSAEARFWTWLAAGLWAAAVLGLGVLRWRVIMERRRQRAANGA